MNTESEDALITNAQRYRITLLREVYRDGPQPVTGRLFDLMFGDVLCETWCRMVGLKYEREEPEHEKAPPVYTFFVDEGCEVPEKEELLEDVSNDEL